MAVRCGSTGGTCLLCHVTNSSAHRSPCTPLHNKLFEDSITCAAPIEYVAPPHRTPLLWAECRTLIRSVHPADWLWSWLDGPAWAQWSRDWVAHLHSLVHAMPYILAVAIVLFALQQLVRRIRRNISPNVPLMITEPLRMAAVMLKW